VHKSNKHIKALKPRTPEELQLLGKATYYSFIHLFQILQLKIVYFETYFFLYLHSK